MWILYSLLSAVFSAFCAILEKKALFRLEPLDFSCALYFCLAVAFSLVFFFSGGGLGDIDGYTFFFIWLKSLTNAVSFLFIMYGIKRMELSAGLPMLLLAPAFVAVFAYLLFGDSMTLRQVAGIGLITAGGYCLKRDGKAGDSAGGYAYLYFFAALLVLTGSSLLNRYILVSRNVSPLNFAFVEHLLAVPDFVVIAFFFRRSPAVALKAARAFPLLLAGVAVATACYRFFEVAAMAQANPALVTALKRLSVVLSVLIGGKLFQEQNIGRRVAASLVMFLGASLIAI